MKNFTIKEEYNKCTPIDGRPQICPKINVVSRKVNTTQQIVLTLNLSTFEVRFKHPNYLL